MFLSVADFEPSIDDFYGVIWLSAAASGSWCDSTVCQVNGGRCEVNKDGSSYCDCEFNCEAIRYHNLHLSLSLSSHVTYHME